MPNLPINQNFYIEEHGKYKIDSSTSQWSMGNHKETIDLANMQFSSVDFVIETEQELLLIEYKNSTNAENNDSAEIFDRELRTAKHKEQARLIEPYGSKKTDSTWQSMDYLNGLLYSI